MNSGKSAARTVAGKLPFLSWVLRSLLSSIYIFRAENIYAFTLLSIITMVSLIILYSLFFAILQQLFGQKPLLLQLHIDLLLILPELISLLFELLKWGNKRHEQTKHLHCTQIRFKLIQPYQLLVDPGLEIVAVCTNYSSYNLIITGCAYVKVLR